MDTGSQTRIAVLIDADNTSATYAEALLDEIAKYGNPTVKRAYGDWSSPNLSGWARELNARAIRGMHQSAFTKGKNSTDSALIIDAMDLLYSGHVEAFALVTSDSDFTSLALRLRESGMTVYGLGRKRTPASLQNACDKFIQLEVLGEEDDEPAEEAAPGADSNESAAPSINLQSALTKAVNAVSGEDGWAGLSALGQQLNRTHPSFDTRSFGHPRLSSLVDAQHYLETDDSGAQLQVRLKGHTPRKRPTTSTGKTAKKSAPTRAPSKRDG